VLDVACGPANQLALLAGLHPQTRFVGVDASSGMLAHARRTLDASDVRNVELMHGDMSRLIPLPDGSMDCVVCTMSLHHLPDRAALDATMAEMRRVLKPGGRLYLTDFGRLKWLGTQRFFARDLQQSEQFTQDYFQSLRAAFSVEELSAAVAGLRTEMPRYVTALAPFIVVFRSAAGRDLDVPTLERISAMYAGLSPQQQDNFRGLANWFRVSGLKLPCALT
jgi:arsenite methyltransferase